MNKLDWGKMFEVVCRSYVFIFLNFYGIGKIMGGQFYRKGQLPAEVAQTTIEQASAYDLAWSFMGYSFVYIFSLKNLLSRATFHFFYPLVRCRTDEFCAHNS